MRTDWHFYMWEPEWNPTSASHMSENRLWERVQMCTHTHTNMEPDRFSHGTQIRFSEFSIILLVPLVLLLTWDCYSSPCCYYFSPIVILLSLLLLLFFFTAITVLPLLLFYSLLVLLFSLLLLVWTLCIMHRCVTSTMFGSCFWFLRKTFIFSNNHWSPPPNPRSGLLPHRPPQEWRHIREVE
jgi:hypothetical protein